LLKPTSAEHLIFSTDGVKPISKPLLLHHFAQLLKAAGITNNAERNIVPYSLRHFMITQRVMSGLSFEQIAGMCGTSVAQIERTYYHLNDDIRRTAALADYRVEADGTIRTTTLFERSMLSSSNTANAAALPETDSRLP
jgi:integrase